METGPFFTQLNVCHISCVFTSEEYHGCNVKEKQFSIHDHAFQNNREVIAI